MTNYKVIGIDKAGRNIVQYVTAKNATEARKIAVGGFVESYDCTIKGNFKGIHSIVRA